MMIEIQVERLYSNNHFKKSVFPAGVFLVYFAATNSSVAVTDLLLRQTFNQLNFFYFDLHQYAFFYFPLKFSIAEEVVLRGEKQIDTRRKRKKVT